MGDPQLGQNSEGSGSSLSCGLLNVLSLPANNLKSVSGTTTIQRNAEPAKV
jgi:hypothetical protein